MAYEIAIPDDESKTLQDYLDALRRRGMTAAKLAAAVLVLGLIIIFLWPNTYRSTATILIEDPEIPAALVPTTVTTYAARQIQYINQRVMTRTNLAQIIEKFNLFPDERKYLPTLLLVDSVQKDVKIDIIDAPMADQQTGQKMNTTIAFTVGFEHHDPTTASQVANELVSLYLAENVRSRTEQTAQTSQFMQAEADRLDGEVRDLESQIATIKKENEGSLPEQAALNQSLLDRTEGELRDTEMRIRQVQDTRMVLDAQLAQIDPMSTLITPEGKGVASPTDQLRALESQLSILESRYSADHPDVVRTRRDIEALRAEVGEVTAKDLDAQLRDANARLSQAQEKYSDDHPEVVALKKEVASLEKRKADFAARPARTQRATREPSNPAYVQVLAQRRQLDGTEQALIQQKAALQQKMATLEQRINQSSDVAQQLNNLTRKLETTSLSYQGVRSRLTMAQMGQSMETQSKGERFSLVEPPDLPLLPSSPNRPVLLALLIILTLATAFGYPQVAESMDSSINSARAVERAQGSPPIAEIPLIQTETDRSQTRKIRVSALIIAPIVVAILAVLIHFFWIPLDVLWYVALRRFGM